MSLRIAILGSGSSGNATLAATDRVRVLIDAGFSYRGLAKRLHQIGEEIEAIDAVVISHEHSDHVKCLPTLAKRTRARILMTEGTASTIDWGDAEPNLELFPAGSRIQFGDLELDTFTVPHDAMDPVAFCVRSHGVKVGLVTDLGYVTESIKRRVEGCDMLVLESNHDLEMLKAGPYPWTVKQRVMSRVGHLSNQAVADFLLEDFDQSAQILVLAHLSGNNNHPELARMEAEQALSRAGAAHTRLIVAEQQRPSEVFQF